MKALLELVISSLVWLWVSGKGHSAGFTSFILLYRTAARLKVGSVDLKNILTGFVLWLGIK